MKVNELIDKLLELIYPKRCLLCDEVLPYNTAATLCRPCKGNVMYLTMCICRKCGKPHIDPGDDLCYDCSKKEHFFRQGRGMWIYEGDVKKAIHKYKYQHRKAQGKGFADELSQFYRQNTAWDIDIITSVPLHPLKLKERSFNQSAYLATVFGQKLDIEVNNNLLIRIKNTKPQKDLTDLQRILNVENAFQMKSEYQCHNQNILILDDIYTTGSTIDNCAKVLLKNGARNVYFLTLAIGKGF